MMLRFLFAGFLIAVAANPAGFARQSGESLAIDRLKAAYIFNFIQFVEWPPGTLREGNSPIVIGVFSGNSMGKALKELVQGETVGGHPLEVRTLQEPEDARECHVVVIPAADEPRIPAILAALVDAPSLTIGESDRFAERGGAISLYVAGNKLRFSINPTTLRSHDLKVSAKLLRLGTIVGEHEP